MLFIIPWRAVAKGLDKLLLRGRTRQVRWREDEDWRAIDNRFATEFNRNLTIPLDDVRGNRWWFFVVAFLDVSISSGFGATGTIPAKPTSL